MKEITDQLAKIVSIIFIPPVTLLLVFLYVGEFYLVDPREKIISIIVAVIFGFVIPLIIFAILRMKKIVSDNDASRKEERTIPFAFGILLSSIGLMISIMFELNSIIIALWFGYILISFLILVINRYWKISAHSVGISILFTIMFYLDDGKSYYLLLILLMVALSRFKLKTHSVLQIAAGMILGFGVTYFSLFLITILFT